ncbi:hypothetical protein GYMLUDRAFT_85876, partial [Collybiopsis luxurians FD-317 M1]
MDFSLRATTPHPLVERFWRFIIAHPHITDSIRAFEFSVYSISPEELERLDFILAHLSRLERIRVDGNDPKIYHLRTIQTSFSDTLKELQVSTITAALFEAFQNMLNSLAVLKVLVLFEIRPGHTERPLILPSSLKIASFDCMSMSILRCVVLGLAISLNPPILRVLYLELFLHSERRSLENNPKFQFFWNALRINGTQVVLKVDNLLTYPMHPSDIALEVVDLALVAFVKDMRVSRIMFDLQARSGVLVCLLTGFVLELPDTIHDICIDIDAVCQKFDTLLVPKILRKPWLELDSLLIRRHLVPTSPIQLCIITISKTVQDKLFSQDTRRVDLKQSSIQVNGSSND